MAFGSNKLGGTSKSFGEGINKGFKSPADQPSLSSTKFDNPFKFTPKDNSLKSQVRFLDKDSLWARWRRGYELFTITQSFLGSFGDKRSTYGDFRLYFVYQLYPGIFIPARLFCFPTAIQETKTQLVAFRDADAFNFYNYSLPILAVRYLKDSANGTYVQSGTTVTVALSNHGFQISDSVYLRFTSGTAVTSTLQITSTTVDTFTCTAASPLSTSGNVTVFLSTTFGDSRWTQTRVQIRSIFSPIPSLIGDRIVDRVVERDSGISASYSRVGSTVTVNCTQAHGLSTGNSIFAQVLGGSVAARQYVATVTSTTQLQFTTYDAGVTAGSMVVKRLVIGFEYGDYVGYTLTGVDYTTNELIFQRKDSYGAKTVATKAVATYPAERGFTVGRFLTTEVRYQCTCQDYLRKNNYNLYEKGSKKKFPTTPIGSTKPGDSLNKDNSITPNRDNPGVHTDFGYTLLLSDLNKLPNYSDSRSNSYPNIYYYQLRWCKHIYAAMFSLNHDEGNLPILGAGTYKQVGPNISVQISNHNLAVNDKVQINFTSGFALSGEYSVSQVVDTNNFNIVYPFSGTTNGYCDIQNLRRHQFVESWINEPSDKPVGDGSDIFYKNLSKENNRTQQEAERQQMMNYGMEWTGVASILGVGNQPQQVADYSIKESSMLLADDLRKAGNQFTTAGELLNKTERLADVMSKLINVEPSQIQSENFGTLDQPLYNYDTNYRYGYVNGGEYLNGKPYSTFGVSSTTSGVVTEDPNTVTVLDCTTYDPVTSQEIIVDGGGYSS